MGNSDVEEDGEGVDVDGALTTMGDSDLVRHDEEHVACFIFDQNTVLTMARTPLLPPWLVCTPISERTLNCNVGLFCTQEMIWWTILLVSTRSEGSKAGLRRSLFQRNLLCVGVRDDKM